MKTLLITGASKGIGLAVARMCLADNYRVVNLSRSPAPDAGIENHAIDLSSSSAESRLKSLLGKVLEQGEIVLVHNAAKLHSDTANNTSTDDFRDIMDINLIAPHTLNQLVIPFMQPGSSIIYIGSTLSEKAVANTYSYVVSKHAMIGMMRATCQDLAGSGIHTACVCPGFTDTEMLRDHVGEDQEVLNSIAAMSTFGRLVSPIEVATTIKFAAENPVINGAVIHANLGQIES
ncbi:SDR family oxidoreductase [Pseudomonadales bacterium]|nr:SDR family oxidoreductase [Pseudomonadales bacterium]MDA9297535.1 SDR family oxidoreductase [Pseudomonadales bacterium]MDA9315754.1 SDR family oxidoreductase [Pseudomonadales bacterium]MDB9867545.1 SDR family oxidoreductase [Pseudomonadales bacterium]MDB9917686.1 SDR family oxidoreductase [Pseudomonadales bacterium]|tara:strand:- start:1071 stop:1769 length:699 start_codon:yes stop_codon:yes gene_type:complete